MDLLPMPLPPPVMEQPPPDANPAPAPALPTSSKCRNCNKDNAELRCSVCRKAFYCSAQCQRSDWQFHKRTCTKPKDPSTETPAGPPPSSSSSSGSSSSSNSSSTGTSTPKASSDKPVGTKSSTEVVGDDDLDEDERAAVEEVRKKGYRYFARKLDEKETNAIGDIRPKAITTPVPSTTTTTNNVSSTASSSLSSSTTSSNIPSSTPTPVPTPVTGTASTASEWNKGGTTMEQRDYGEFVRLRIKELLKEKRKKGDLTINPIPGIGQLVVTGISGWGDSSADIVITRGKTKKIYDISFKVVVQIIPENTTSNTNTENDDEMDDDTVTKPKNNNKNNNNNNNNNNAKDDKSNGDSTDKKDDTKKDTDKPKYPRALLFFKEVSNESENNDKGREVLLEWGSPSPIDNQKDVIRTALAVNNAQTGITKVVRDIVEQVIDEFKAK